MAFHFILLIILKIEISVHRDLIYFRLFPVCDSMGSLLRQHVPYCIRRITVTPDVTVSSITIATQNAAMYMYYLFALFILSVIPGCAPFFQPTLEIWWVISSILLTNIQIISRILKVICHYIFTQNLNIIWAQKHLQIYINVFTFYMELDRFQNWGSRQLSNYGKLKQKLVIQH